MSPPVSGGMPSRVSRGDRAWAASSSAPEAVIGLIVRGTNEQLGALTGRRGSLPGVRAKSALTSAKAAQPPQERKE